MVWFRNLKRGSLSDEEGASSQRMLPTAFGRYPVGMLLGWNRGHLRVRSYPSTRPVSVHTMAPHVSDPQTCPKATANPLCTGPTFNNLNIVTRENLLGQGLVFMNKKSSREHQQGVVREGRGESEQLNSKAFLH